jgi:hypothetical protein
MPFDWARYLELARLLQADSAKATDPDGGVA